MDPSETPRPGTADEIVGRPDANRVAAALAAHRVLGQLGDDARAALQARLAPQPPPPRRVTR